MRLIWKISKVFVSLFGLQNVIFIEAERGTRENTQAVFREMLRRKWIRRYRFVLITEKPEDLAHLRSKRVTVMKRSNVGISRCQKWKRRFIRLRAAMIVDENRQTRKTTSRTIKIYLSHGSPAKSLRAYYTCNPDTDFMLCQSDYWKSVDSYEFNISEEKLVVLGFPRNDNLFSRKVDMTALFGPSIKKVVIWYPTYRQHDHSSIKLYQGPISIPVLHDLDAARAINALAAKYGVLVVVKPHPAQDLSLIQELHLDHLMFIYDGFFINHGIASYEFLAETDALITDYSSVFFDYLLTGKPIALTFEDFEEYKKQIGFAIDTDIMRSCSTMLDTVEDFEGFFRDLAAGNDPLKEKRDEVTRLTNKYLDGNSTKRVVDWMETLLPYPLK